MRMQWRWRRSDYGPGAIETMIQVIRDELMAVQQSCDSDETSICKISDGLKNARIQIELSEKFLAQITEIKEPCRS